jgi:hypothetical protein
MGDAVSIATVAMLGILTGIIIACLLIAIVELVCAGLDRRHDSDSRP